MDAIDRLTELFITDEHAKTILLPFAPQYEKPLIDALIAELRERLPIVDAFTCDYKEGMTPKDAVYLVATRFDGLSADVAQNLVEKFGDKTNFKMQDLRAFLFCLCSSINRLMVEFDRKDKTNNGLLLHKKVKKIVEKFNINGQKEAEIMEIIKSYDNDCSGNISKAEFIRMWIQYFKMEQIKAM